MMEPLKAEELGLGLLVLLFCGILPLTVLCVCAMAFIVKIYNFFKERGKQCCSMN